MPCVYVAIYLRKIEQLCWVVLSLQRLSNVSACLSKKASRASISSIAVGTRHAACCSTH